MAPVSGSAKGAAKRLRALVAQIDGAEGYDPDEWIIEAAGEMELAADLLDPLADVRLPQGGDASDRPVPHVQP